MRGFCAVSKVGKINSGLGKYTLVTHSELRAGMTKQGKEVAGSYSWKSKWKAVRLMDKGKTEKSWMPLCLNIIYNSTMYTM